MRAMGDMRGHQTRRMCVLGATCVGAGKGRSALGERVHVRARAVYVVDVEREGRFTCVTPTVCGVCAVTGTLF